MSLRQSDNEPPATVVSTKPLERLRVRRIVVHEAGHAVICCDVGIAVECVGFALPEGQLGYCKYEEQLDQALATDFAAWGERSYWP